MYDKEKSREKTRKSYIKHRDKRLEESRKWRANNLEYARYLSRDWNRRNSEKMKQVNLAYYYRHREEKLIKQRAHRKANREKQNEIKRRWYHKNKEVSRAQAHRKKAKRRAIGGTKPFSADVIKRMMVSQKNKCYWCKKKMNDKWHIDHVWPLSKGGLNNDGNIVITCPPCNLVKKDKLPHESVGVLL